MVWMHGGGWSQGSGSSPLTDGSRLAELGDVVVITLNHRLTLFGYIALDDRDERFADSGNTGVLDMVAALRWVRDNAAAFSGDPANVTIFGVSGGGSKVSALMAAPAAEGLFHKVIAQSCSGTLRITEPPEAAALARDLARRLGLPRATGAALQALPIEQLAGAARGPFRPVLDGRSFIRHPFDPDATAQSRKIPFLAGNMATETTHHLAADAGNFSLDAAEVRMRLLRYLPAQPAEVDRIVAIYQAADPAASPSRLLQRITTDYQYIRNTRREVALQATAGSAPAYAYLFAWPTPVHGGGLGSPHGMDVPFVFGTTDAAQALVGSGPALEILSRMMIATWSAFAYTGDPNNPALPYWPTYDDAHRATMVLNLASRVERDPGGEVRAALDPLPFYEYSMPITFARHGETPPGDAF
jgi:para-nitrobenzyl esterase